jgi:hypothetical protein
MIAETMIVAARAGMTTAAVGTTGAKMTVVETVIAMLHAPAGAAMTLVVREAIAVVDLAAATMTNNIDYRGGGGGGGGGSRYDDNRR